jgi:hypothetical protein
MNQPTMIFFFYFNYDGTSPTVSIDTRTGPIMYAAQNGTLPPTFADTPTSVVDVRAESQAVNLPTTATMVGRKVIVDIPAGFVVALGCTITGTFLY